MVRVEFIADRRSGNIDLRINTLDEFTCMYTTFTQGTLKTLINSDRIEPGKISYQVARFGLQGKLVEPNIWLT